MSDGPAGSISVAQFDLAPAADAAAELIGCCASRRWVAELVEGRPYRTRSRLVAASDTSLGRLSWDGIAEALAAHPRIGDRAAGADRESSWSRQEQAGTADADGAIRAELAALNVVYEQQFDHVFLICATGLSAAEMLANLRFRLGNDPESEQRTVRAELGKIVRLRLAKAFH